ncbi:MAG: SMI1/KNR4 family protein [Gammaproteobacteria bacterium]|nr:SMI1/KNR4 family protein [Gammaproteobacteria bacterium]
MDWDWRLLLEPWEKEVLEILQEEDRLDKQLHAQLNDQAGQSDYVFSPPETLFFPPANNEDIEALEDRLGSHLPSSYKAFLLCTNGWLQVGMDGQDGKIYSSREVDWLKNSPPNQLSYWIDLDLLREEPLAISQDIDAAGYVLYPNRIDSRCEWQATIAL